MLYAEKGNKVKEINESMIEACVEQGYKIVNERGEVIQDTIPTDLPTLKLAYKQHTALIREQKATILALEAELKELKATKQVKPVQEKPTETLGTAKKKGKSATE